MLFSLLSLALKSKQWQTGEIFALHRFQEVWVMFAEYFKFDFFIITNYKFDKLQISFKLQIWLLYNDFSKAEQISTWNMIPIVLHTSIIH